MCSVPVLRTGPLDTLAQLTSLVGPSTCRTSDWRAALAATGAADGETDSSDDMEGLYVKVEEGGETVGRYKWVRPSFLTAVLDSGSHWQDRPITPNQLADPAVMYVR